ncbi:MAG TPA: hypothetical protein VNQ79_03980 [Blastocatellia bacterium]|nr:hypothetical protein [Blastocatellia bacterium]
MAKTKPSQQTKPQEHTGTQHPEEYRDDLNPNAGAGQNIGTTGTGPLNDARTVYDIKELHRRMHDFGDAELRQIRILPVGSRLQQGATYIDLSDPHPTEFTATGEMTVEPGHFYAAKSDVPYQLWNRLIGVANPVRTGTGNIDGEIKRS